MSRRWVIVVLLLVGISLVVAGIWVWRSSPVLRYRVLGDPESFSKAFDTLKKGDTIEKVRDILGDRYLDSQAEPAVRQGFRSLAEIYPQHHPEGYRESDVILAYSAIDTGRHGIRFRDGRIIAFCFQAGTTDRR